MTIKTVQSKLVAQKEEPGGYIVLVFENMDENRYIMCTKLPNWNTRTPELGNIGYLQIREFVAGEDSWYDSATGKQIPYCYTGIYFWDFVPKEEKVRQELKLD